MQINEIEFEKSRWRKAQEVDMRSDRRQSKFSKAVKENWFVCS